jgi:hypothetical protein
MLESPNTDIRLEYLPLQEKMEELRGRCYRFIVAIENLPNMGLAEAKWWQHELQDQMQEELNLVKQGFRGVLTQINEDGTYAINGTILPEEEVRRRYPAAFPDAT